MPKPKKPHRRKDTLLYMSALQMMEGLSLIEEQGVCRARSDFVGSTKIRADIANIQSSASLCRPVRGTRDRARSTSVLWNAAP